MARWSRNDVQKSQAIGRSRIQVGMLPYRNGRACQCILAMLKVIATLLRNSSDNIHLYDIKFRFLDEMILLSSVSRENRR